MIHCALSAVLAGFFKADLGGNTPSSIRSENPRVAGVAPSRCRDYSFWARNSALTRIPLSMINSLATAAEPAVATDRPGPPSDQRRAPSEGSPLFGGLLSSEFGVSFFAR
jgi:hypothetical protein